MTTVRTVFMGEESDDLLLAEAAATVISEHGILAPWNIEQVIDAYDQNGGVRTFGAADHFQCLTKLRQWAKRAPTTDRRKKLRGVLQEAAEHYEAKDNVADQPDSEDEDEDKMDGGILPGDGER